MPPAPAPGRRTATRGPWPRIALAAGVLAFLLFVWPTPWEYATVDGRVARVARLTSAVQFRTGRGWEAFGAANKPGANPAPSGTDPTAEQLRSVRLSDDIRVYAELPGGGVAGQVHNAGTRPVVGDVVFHFLLRKPGKDPKERTLRGSLNLPPGATRPFAIKTNLDISPSDDLTVDLRPAPFR